jgi:hypothetical protein
MSMVAENGIKYISVDELPAGADRQTRELFRLVQSPVDWEKKNWIASAPIILGREQEFLARWRAEKGKLQLSADPAPAAPDSRLKEILLALGYLQGMEPMKPLPPAKKEPTGKSSQPARR